MDTRTIKITVIGNGKDARPIMEYFENMTKGYGDLIITNLKISIIKYDFKRKDKIIFSANGPFGKFSDLNEVKLFDLLSKIAPETTFEGIMKISESNRYQKVTASYMNKKLKISFKKSL